ncbi:dTDP-4-dehydrorhamnose reductase [Psychrobacter piscatorii]|uniref:dTDP-4-dehydrorhamnose reductase n=1 Tax=Psychrobacter piscatorii TaxID=554343 RepID=UPI0019185467|nr:dTDP-4-dehydrorhamnose reductase [Psychrobacter piscatorii]
MNIILLGKDGQVGWELQRALQPLGKVFALSRHSNANGLCGDLSNYDTMFSLFTKISPDIVVNAAAYTAVDKAESEQAEADIVNHLAVDNLAKLCKSHQALLVHYSTDYVFDGSGDIPWSEKDVSCPINYYGKSKRAGELALEESGVKFINFRTSWVYSTYGSNFIKTMLNLATDKTQLSIISDQVGSPTGASLIADVTAQVIRYYNLQNSIRCQELHGHYHLAPTGFCSWFEYANFIFDNAKELGKVLAVEEVSAITTEQYPTPAKRPHNSRLNTQKLQTQFDLYLPNWQQGVIHVLKELIHGK